MAGRAIKEIRGATSHIQEVPGTVTGRFDRYEGVKITPIRSELDGLVSEKFTSTLPAAMRKYLIEEKDAPFQGGSPALTIEPQVQWYHEASGAGKLLGSDSYAVVLFKLSADGAALGKLQVATKEAAATAGRKAMAKSMAKKLAHWFTKRRKAEREGKATEAAD